MPASTPLSVSPATVTVLPVPTSAVSKVPVAPPVASVTSSLPTTPTSAAPPTASVAVAPEAIVWLVGSVAIAGPTPIVIVAVAESVVP